jgi:hypothetical protein
MARALDYIVGIVIALAFVALASLVAYALFSNVLLGTLAFFTLLVIGARLAERAL